VAVPLASWLSKKTHKRCAILPQREGMNRGACDVADEEDIAGPEREDTC
jgi:hypothetical protein